MNDQIDYKRIMKTQINHQREIDILKKKVEDLKKRIRKTKYSNNSKRILMPIIKNFTGVGRSSSQVTKSLFKMLLS